MSNTKAAVWTAIVIIASTVQVGWAAPPSIEAVVQELAEATRGPKLLELPVRVVDANDKPVAKAKVTPWALRSSQGHGWWDKDDKVAKVGPVAVFTDADGMAKVLYPKFTYLDEQVSTISVSLSVDHPDFAFINDLHIDVPLEESGPHVIHLVTGVPLEIRPTVDGKPTDLNDIFAIWSDGRSWEAGTALKKLPGGVLQIPSMPPGENSFLLVKLDGDRATHFSQLTEFKLISGESKKLDVPLRPSVRVTGALSDNVPRPVRAGRIKASTLEPADAAANRVSWFTWVVIQPDGTFTIEGWPAEESLQLIALCDGYMAESGRAPDCVKNAPDPSEDPFSRPQVFNPVPDRRIELVMTPLARCNVTTVDEDDKPVAGVSVGSWPNVGWWNSGSQIYCESLVRGERRLRERAYYKSVDKSFPQPFVVETKATGKATLELPAGREHLTVMGEVYELPVFLGHRTVEIKLSGNETIEKVLRIQPRGTDKLGEWDKLAGVVFGCSTREGRRICALPAVRKKMDEFETRFREAKNQRDPQLLSEAYTAVAEAFVGVGDHVEAVKWRQKANEQAAKAKAVKPSAE